MSVNPMKPKAIVSCDCRTQLNIKTLDMLDYDHILHITVEPHKCKPAEKDLLLKIVDLNKQLAAYKLKLEHITEFVKLLRR